MAKLWGHVRRWAPLLSVVGLTATSILREAGKSSAAGIGETAFRLLELTVTDPTMAATVTAFAGSLYATFKKGAEVVKAIRKPS